MKKFWCIASAAMAIGLLSSCTFNFGGGNENKPSSNTQNAGSESYNESDLAKNISVMSKKNIVNPNKTYADDYLYAEDEENYYIVFHMGYMENVPLTDTYEYKYYGGSGVL